MAEVLKPLVVKSATVAFEDYTGSPLTYSAGNIEPASAQPFLTLARTYERVMKNSSGGTVIHASVDAGQDAAGRPFDVTYIGNDFNNTTDATNVELHRGLHLNNLAGRTGFGSWVTTGPLAGSGKDTVKMEMTIKDNTGGTHIMTVPVSVTDVQVTVQGEHYGLQATYDPVAEPVWS